MTGFSSDRAIGHPLGFSGVLEELGATADEALVDMDDLITGLDRDCLAGEAVMYQQR